jgi:hypothetical protein
MSKNTIHPSQVAAMLGIDHESIKKAIAADAVKAIQTAHEAAVLVSAVVPGMMLRAYYAGVQAGQGGTR